MRTGAQRLIGRRVHAAMAVLIAAVAFAGTGDVTRAIDSVVVAGIPNPTVIGQVSAPIQNAQVDSLGNIYFAVPYHDTYGARIWKATPAGALSVVAGTGVNGFSGDGGPAIDAEVSGVSSIEFDALGNLYFVDGLRIRRIDGATGVMSTVAGSGNYGDGGNGGPATAADLTYVRDIAVDSLGNVFLADGPSVRKVSAATGLIAAIAGGGVFSDCANLAGPATAATFYQSTALGIDSADNLYVGVNCFSGGDRILRVTPAGESTVFAGGGASIPGDGGPATSATIYVADIEIGPADAVLFGVSTVPVRQITQAGVLSTIVDYSDFQFGFAVQANGDLVVSGNPGIASIVGTTTTQLTASPIGDPPDGTLATSTPLGGFSSLAVDASGRLFYSTSSGPKVRTIDAAGLLGTAIGNGDYNLPTYGAAATASPFFPRSILHSGVDGNLYATVYGDVARVGSDGILTEFVDYDETQLSPVGVTSTPAGVFVAGRQSDGFTSTFKVLEVDGAGAVTTAWTDPVGFPFYTDLAASPDGTLLLAPGTGATMLRLDPDDGATTPIPFAPGFNGNTQIAVDAAGNIFVVTPSGGGGPGGRLSKIDTSGSVTVIDEVAAIDIDIDAGGNVYVMQSTGILKYGGLAVGEPTSVSWPDFDGDGSADRGVFRPEVGGWYINNQPTDFLGLAGDIPVPADFDGDGTTDRAVYRDGAWYIDNQPTVFLGAPGDIPVPGDYDGDGSVDPAVFRDGAWYINGQPTVFYGLATDIPVPGDYNGDGTTEVAVYRPSVGGWYIDGQPTVFYGLDTDIAVPADYNGDGSVDRAVYRPAFGGWYVEGQPTEFIGLSTDVPVPADYNGDGTADRAVYRPEVGGWYTESQPTVFYGLNTDTPLSLPAAIYNTHF